MNDNFSIEKIIDFLRKRYYLMPLNIHLISDSYSKVYKINADNGKQYALLVNRKNKNEGDIRAEFTILKQLSQINLGVLSVPKPVFPKKYTNLDIKKHYLNGHFIALYEWVDHYSYDGTIEEAKKAFSAYVDLRKGLDKIHRPNELKELALLRGILDEKQFNFEKFIPYLSDTSFGNHYQERVKIFNEITERMLSFYKRHKKFILSMNRSIIHYDLSPRNFGFDKNGKVIFFMDFDQCKWGVWQYDIPWMIWSYSSFGINLSDITKQKLMINRLSILYHELAKIGIVVDVPFFLFYLLTRFCLTLYGRLQDTFERGFYNLRFMDDKIESLCFLFKFYDALEIELNA